MAPGKHAPAFLPAPSLIDTLMHSDNFFPSFSIPSMSWPYMSFHNQFLLGFQSANFTKILSQICNKLLNITLSVYRHFFMSAPIYLLSTFIYIYPHLLSSVHLCSVWHLSIYPPSVHVFSFYPLSSYLLTVSIYLSIYLSSVRFLLSSLNFLLTYLLSTV